MSHLRRKSYNWEQGKERIHMVSGSSPVAVHLFSAHESRNNSPILSCGEGRNYENFRNEKEPVCFCCKYKTNGAKCSVIEKLKKPENSFCKCERIKAKSGVTEKVKGSACPCCNFEPIGDRYSNEEQRKKPRCLCCQYKHSGDKCCVIDYCRCRSVNSDNSSDRENKEKILYPSYMNKKFGNLKHVCQGCQDKFDDERPVESKESLDPYHVCQDCQKKFERGRPVERSRSKEKLGQKCFVWKSKSNKRSKTPIEKYASNCCKECDGHQLPQYDNKFSQKKGSHQGVSREISGRAAIDGISCNCSHICSHCSFRKTIGKSGIGYREYPMYTHYSSYRRVCPHCIFKKNFKCSNCMKSDEKTRSNNVYYNSSRCCSQALMRPGSLYSVRSMENLSNVL